MRNKFKVISLFLFLFVGVYGLINGLDLYKNQQNEIQKINTENTESIKKVVDWYEKGKKGPEGKPWVDIADPFWAGWFTPTYSVKTPSALLPFSIGQSEQYGYYKKVTNWSTVYDSDLAAEIANPERVHLGTLDFSFVVLYLLPILLIILLFNVGGAENENGLLALVQVQAPNFHKWLLYRFGVYFFMVIASLLLIILPFAFITGAIYESSFFALMGIILGYVVFWFGIFAFINLSKNASVANALKMMGVWVLLCLAIPGAVQLMANIKYPANYMTEYIDANREETYKTLEWHKERKITKLFELYPQLKQTKIGEDTTTITNDLLRDSANGIANDMMKKAAEKVALQNQEKNEFIQGFYILSPVNFFENKINNVSQTDYFAYQNYRNDIQFLIDKKTTLLMVDCWNEVKMDKNKYSQFVEKFKKK